MTRLPTFASSNSPWTMKPSIDSHDRLTVKSLISISSALSDQVTITDWLRPSSINNHRLQPPYWRSSAPTFLWQLHCCYVTCILCLFNAALSCRCFVQTHCGQVIVILHHQSILNRLCYHVFFFLRCSLFSGLNETDYYLHAETIFITHLSLNAK